MSGLRRAGIGAVLMAVTISGTLGLRSAEAAVACRADPVVTLSNGVQVQMYTDISDLSTNVTNVAYVLHAPKGTSVKSVTYPSDMATNIPETFTFYADDAVSSYTNTAYVTDANKTVAVTAYSIATNSAGTKSKSQSKAGYADQTLQMVLVLVQ